VLTYNSVINRTPTTIKPDRACKEFLYSLSRYWEPFGAEVKTRKSNLIVEHF
jgi:hypothetical protein